MSSMSSYLTRSHFLVHFIFGQHNGSCQNQFVQNRSVSCDRRRFFLIFKIEILIESVSLSEKFSATMNPVLDICRLLSASVAQLASVCTMTTAVYFWFLLSMALRAADQFQ